MSGSRTCPHCGAVVYETDPVCVSCGQALEAPAQAAPVASGPGEAPAASSAVPRDWERPPIQLSRPQRLVNACGNYWELYPWIVMGYIGLAGLLGVLGMPTIVLQVLGGLFLPLWLALWGWLVVDMLALQGAWWWLVVAWFFGPLGFIAYLLWGR